MPKRILAVALCRVSSIEQLENNSLGHQKGNVLRAAAQLGAIIPDDAVWEGAVSSKKGVSFNRKDLRQIYEYCRKNPDVRYVIVQEVDRFMRSPDEQTYFYVKFWYELRVRIWFADKPELNEDTHVASLLRYMEGWRAAGSNEERQNKSINGQTAALKEGRYPFSPKPGYKRGYERAIQEIHPVRGTALQSVLVRLASHMITPTQALIELNKSDFVKDGHAPYKMDKFRKIVADPFYAGIVEVDKQVKFRNENGLHKAIITKEQHYELVKIINGKKKNQAGPRKNGNPKYPGNNIIHCDLCKEKQYGRYVGYDHGNGQNPKLIYEKYRCRSCSRYLTRDEVHKAIAECFKQKPTKEGVEELIKALNVVWKQKEGEAVQETARIAHIISNLEIDVMNKVEAATNPENASIKAEILTAIKNKKEEITKLEDDLTKLKDIADNDKAQFMRFAFDFIGNTGKRFLDPELSQENRLRCKQIVFPAGFHIDANNNVYTPEISPLYRLATIKKDTEVSDNSHLVRVKRL